MEAPLEGAKKESWKNPVTRQTHRSLFLKEQEETIEGKTGHLWKGACFSKGALKEAPLKRARKSLEESPCNKANAYKDFVDRCKKNEET